MYRTHTCGELRIEHLGQKTVLSGWVQRVRSLGALTFVDLRDRYGITQLFFDLESMPELTERANKELGREFVIQVEGTVQERSSKNAKMSTGDIEIHVDGFKILNKAELPPFTIEDKTDGGEELRYQYRFLDLRRNPIQKNLILRHRFAKEVRNYLDNLDFIEVETPYLIKSTPEGARDFVVPSRMNPGEFYALPQSPQTLKQLLMVGGFDKYYQIVKCFRDEDLRSDRQPEFTQIDCELSFVERDDILNIFEGMAKHVFKAVMDVEITHDFPRMTYKDAMEKYGNDKPDIRFGMPISEISELVKGKDFKVFDDAEYIGAICAENCSEFTRKQLDALTDFVKRPQIGSKGLIYLKYNTDGSLKSSVDKFYNPEELQKWATALNAKPGDLILVLSGDKKQTLPALSELRLEMGKQLGLRDNSVFAPLWVVDFPVVEWSEEEQRYFAMHHPFTSPKLEDLEIMDKNPGEARANAYDMVINGVEIGGGSIRIHDTKLQQKMFNWLGFTPEEAQNQFGFLIDAFKYGAPPHGGIAFGLDRWVSLFAKVDSIKDVIAFPKNNSGRDTMMDAPSSIADKQLKELNIEVKLSPGK
jgi:aspartyl-tRNA synthetase